jgi:diketogulonate reductase-like aldo/keto reductase
MEYITLNNDVKMPVLGYGTFQTPPTQTVQVVADALKVGYRSIDTAQVYQNESGVGAAVSSSGLKRSDVFITSKTQTKGYQATLQGIDESLKRLNSDYLDLIIIHWPNGDDIETYKALEQALKEGKTRAIGVSNFNIKQLEILMKNTDVVPAVDQIETHLYWQQQKMHPFLKENGIKHESWAPLGENFGGEMMNLPEIKDLANKYHVSSAQVLLRFLTQQGIITIPKSTNMEHIKSNFDSFSFKMTDEEIESLRKFDKHHSIKNWPESMNETAY